MPSPRPRNTAHRDPAAGRSTAQPRSGRGRRAGAARAPGELIEAVRRLPGGSALLSLAAPRDDVELVGGAVRDLLLGLPPEELDVAIDAGRDTFKTAAATFAAELHRALRSEQSAFAEDLRICTHERFGTAALRWPGFGVDIAVRRSETYPRPGALPLVAPGTPQEDLQRRDFTVNAIAISLSSASLGRMRAAAHAIDDLEARRLRVLHDRSFSEDPTRLWRLGRYAGRLHFRVHRDTSRLAAQAVEEGAPATVSAARTGAELRLACAESDPAAVLCELAKLRLLRSIDDRISVERGLIETALSLLPAEGRADLLALSAIMLPLPHQQVRGLLQSFEYSAADCRVVVEAVERGRTLAARIAAAGSASALWELLRGCAVETVALAGALGGEPGGEAARRWISELRHSRLGITGDDLIRAGIEPGPQIRCALDRAMRDLLDGRIPHTAEAELEVALQSCDAVRRSR